MPEIERKFLTISEAARVIGVSPLTLRNWDRKGLLVASRHPVNNYRLYGYSDVADLLAAISRKNAARASSRKIPVIEILEADRAAEVFTPDQDPRDAA